MSLFNDKEILRQIIISHYDQPKNKVDEDFDTKDYECFHNKSLSCIDDFELCLKIDNNKIVDAKFKGIGCAISTASVDIFCDMLKDRTKQEAMELLDNYFRMIKNEEYNQEMMQELIAFSDIHNQPNRIKCSLIGYDAIKNILNK